MTKQAELDPRNLTMESVAAVGKRNSKQQRRDEA